MHSKRLDQFKVAVREELRDQRTSLGLSMNRLAEKAGLSQQSVSYLERGIRQPSMESLARICNAMSIRLSDFIRKVEDRCKDESDGERKVVRYSPGRPSTKATRRP